jgi:hypothetical protein
MRMCRERFYPSYLELPAIRGERVRIVCVARLIGFDVFRREMNQSALTGMAIAELFFLCYPLHYADAFLIGSVLA